uniref:Photosystem II subunit K n=1 Tax=Selaginella lepidophylla TaxID=59777 RepID=A0A3Q9R2T5_SELLP|nr:photosystem II subunit K [Selaginella lepidophylla]AZU95884.1 photosystem II subunit K [Selaginella lepidophylla]
MLVTLETLGNTAYSSTVLAKSPEVYAISDPAVDVTPIIPLLSPLPASVRQAPASPR